MAIDRVLEQKSMALERKSRVVEWESIAVERELLASDRRRWASDRRRWNLDKQDHERMVEEERQKRSGRDKSRSAIVLKLEYSAILAQVPIGLDPLEGRRAKPVNIQESLRRALSETEQNVCGHVRGYWTVDFNEGACVTSFRDFSDKGCVQSGIHRYDAHLENLQNGDDWREMCSTTPYNIHGHHYAHPTICTDWGRWGIGGIWDVEDTHCP
ncbi:hypothetical protein B0H34DRAFT_675551 [Crassisporium funariophilum]|nr:hypothetical protein B0H34DRAFT_675551 [Crassisporium funariophilum]